MQSAKLEMKTSTEGSHSGRTRDKMSSVPVAWAIDPMEKKSSALGKMKEMLQVWGGKIVPVTVLSPMDLGWPMPITSKLEKELILRAQEKSKALFEKHSLPGGPAQILVSRHLSLLSAVEKFLRLAAKKKSEVVALYSRTGPRKENSGVGSFAELTIGTSKLPVLIITDQTQIPKKVSKILLPTDFDSSRKKAFQLALQLAKRHDAELVLYHHAGTPLTPLTFTSFGAPFEALWMESAYEANQQDEKKRGEKLLAEARKQKVRCRMIPDFAPESWSQRVLDINAREKCDLIVISVRRGVWGQAIFGNKIRKMIAESKSPLVFVHSF